MLPKKDIVFKRLIAFKPCDGGKEDAGGDIG